MFIATYPTLSFEVPKQSFGHEAILVPHFPSFVLCNFAQFQQDFTSAKINWVCMQFEADAYTHLTFTSSRLETRVKTRWKNSSRSTDKIHVR